MDAWALGIIAISLVLYFVSKRKNVFLFTTGIGTGIFVGAVWALVIIDGTSRYGWH